MIYRVFKQLFPTKVLDAAGNVEDFAPNLVRMGEIEASSGAEAIALAKKTPAFSRTPKNSLAAFPIVEEFKS